MVCVFSVDVPVLGQFSKCGLLMIHTGVILACDDDDDSGLFFFFSPWCGPGVKWVTDFTTAVSWMKHEGKAAVCVVIG